MWLRIMVRWWLLAACVMVPWAVVAVLTFRFHAIPETVAVVSKWGWCALGVGMAFFVRRRARREVEEFARREISEEQWS